MHINMSMMIRLGLGQLTLPPVLLLKQRRGLFKSPLERGG
jgi:hypothetical protein